MTKRETLNKILIEYNRIYLSDIMVEKIFKSEYNQQAIEFLLKTDTQIKIESIGQSYPSWNKKSKVNTYEVTLKNAKHEYSYEFYDSINNTEKNVSSVYDFYSVLACMDTYTPESFDDFCSEYGYEFKNESEYIKTKSTHLACLEQVKNLKKLFNSDELSLLSEIR